VCVCVYIYIYTHTHTYTQQLVCVVLKRGLFKYLSKSAYHYNV